MNNGKVKHSLHTQNPLTRSLLIDGIINRLSSEPELEKIKWILREPIKNFGQVIVDDTVRVNADFSIMRT